MSRKTFISISAITTLIFLTSLMVFAFYNMISKDDTIKHRTNLNPNYNPNYSNAILQKDPNLCKDIKYALKSMPNDGIQKISGDEAVNLCSTQAQAGILECECDSDLVLDKMKELYTEN